MSASDEETAPLHTPSTVTDASLSPNSDDHWDETLALPKPRERDPLYIFVFYGLSFVVSVTGLICALWGYGIILGAPFDAGSKKEQRAGYETRFLGMMSVVILVCTLTQLFTFSTHSTGPHQRLIT